MKTIQGFVCIVIMNRREILFGKNMGGGQGHYENFCTNDMTPFKDVSEAQIAKDELQKRSSIQKVSLAELHICLAETMEEIFLLQKEKKIIVIRKAPDKFLPIVLIGKFEESCNRYPLYGSELSDNGMRPFTSFEKAHYTAGEESRQASCPATLATFEIKRLP